MKKELRKLLLTPIFIMLLLYLLPTLQVRAAEATAVSFGTINYETLTMQVYKNGNDIIYYSLDNSTWDELEGSYNNTSDSYTMDISWVGTNSDVTVFFKGDKCKIIKSITLPMQNSAITVDYDKIEGEFTFSDIDDSDYFEWRKASDYNWTKVSFTETSGSYQAFSAAMELFRFRGAKIIIRTPQVIGTGSGKVGTRPSSEVTITIPATTDAPSLKVNSSKLNINTSSAMEYYDAVNNLWLECEGTMSLEDIAPKVLYENGGNSVTLLIRKSATASNPCSKTAKIRIPGQAAAPTIGGNTNDVTYYYYNSKLVMQFNKASLTNVYEYTMVRSGSDLSYNSARWKSVTSTEVMNLSAAAAPSGCTIYVRKKGTDEDLNKNIDLVLPSAMNSFTVSY